MSIEHQRYRAWFVANIPGKAFTFETDSLHDAQVADEAISLFALSLGEDAIYTSAGGVEQWDAGIDDWCGLDGDEMYCSVCGLDRDGDYIWGDPDSPTVEPMHPSPVLPSAGHHEFVPRAVDGAVV